MMENSGQTWIYDGINDVPEWHGVEVHPVRMYDEDNKVWCEPCEEGEETFWSVYLRIVEGGVTCIADFPEKEQAVNLSELLKVIVKKYKPDE